MRTQCFGNQFLWKLLGIGKRNLMVFKLVQTKLNTMRDSNLKIFPGVCRLTSVSYNDTGKSFQVYYCRTFPQDRSSRVYRETCPE